MTHRDWGTYHLVAPSWSSESDDDSQIKRSHRHGPSQARLAIELNRLVGEEDRARAIEAVLEEAAAREDPVLDSSAIGQFRAQLEGLEGRVRAALLDDRGRLRPELLPDLRRRARHLDLDEARGEDARYAGLEALSQVQALEDLLAEALALGLHVLLT